MIEYAFTEDLEDDEPMVLTAEDQCWDDATLKQLRDEYDIVFMTSGDAVLPVMILNKNKHPLLVIGSEDDGSIFFKRQCGQFTNSFSLYWVEPLVNDLREAIKICNEAINRKQD